MILGIALSRETRGSRAMSFSAGKAVFLCRYGRHSNTRRLPKPYVIT
jgi:hypothetical protein